MQLGKIPDTLSRELVQNPHEWVVIDEVQKVPKLLDIVHLEIEKKKTKFALTGSSARKLKRGAGNLLAGRAFTYHLQPLTTHELDKQFDLANALAFGTLPKLMEYTLSDDRNEYLRSYVRTYLKEEILIEQLIRKIDPFRDFLPIAAQMNGHIINYNKIAKDVGVQQPTIQSYFQILDDTLLGFYLPAHHRSIRKRQREAPKFYFFDPGVKRALDGTLSVPLLPQTSAFGKAFEHWAILEVYRLNEYFRKDYQLSYLRTKDDAEIDLIIDRPGQKSVLVEIKSTTRVMESDIRTLARFQKDWKTPVEAQVWSLDPTEQRWGKVQSLHWQRGLDSIMGAHHFLDVREVTDVAD